MNGKVTIEKGKEKGLYKTDILDKFFGGWMVEIKTIFKENQEIKIYVVQSEETTFMFKSIACFLANTKGITQARNEYQLSLQCANLSEAIPKLLDHKEETDEASGRQYIELLYEHYGEDLYSVLGKLNIKEVLAMMAQILKPLVIMEENGIFHSNLNSENIAVEGKSIKILNFGASITFNEKVKLIEEGKLKERSYYPPEVLRSESSILNKVDVYSWGIIFYQMMAGKSESDLEGEIELRLTNHDKFIESLDNIEFKDSTLKEDVLEILRKALSSNYKNRPTFKEILDYMVNKDNYREKYIITKQALRNVYSERGKFHIVIY